MKQASLAPKLELVSLKCEYVSDYLILATGEIMNISDNTVKHLITRLEMRDADGKVVDVNNAIVTPADLAPGESVGFELPAQGGPHVTTCDVLFVNPYGRRFVHKNPEGLTDRLPVTDQTY
jgi:hypothetical protein